MIIQLFLWSINFNKILDILYNYSTSKYPAKQSRLTYSCANQWCKQHFGSFINGSLSYSLFFLSHSFSTHGFPSPPLSTSPAPQYLCPLKCLSFTCSLKQLHAFSQFPASLPLVHCSLFLFFVKCSLYSGNDNALPTLTSS